MGSDEEGTHERVKAHLVELLDPKIREHRGRIVKTTGDGVLAEFASVVGTVRDHIGERLPYAFEDMGEQSVKNIARPVRAYALCPEGVAAAPKAVASPSAAAPRLSIVVLP